MLAADVATPRALPLFDQSAVDGYAVRFADIETTPVTLAARRDDRRRARTTRCPRCSPATRRASSPAACCPTAPTRSCARRRRTSATVRSRSCRRFALGTDLRRAGEELAAGAPIASAGATVTAGLLGALAFAGVASVAVREAPHVQVFVTGDEVAPLGAPLRLGQVPDANGPLVMAHLQRWGVPADGRPSLRRSRTQCKTALDEAFSNNRLVITTGGVSVGDFDFIPSVSEELGAERVLWKVAQKPGMPLYVADAATALLIGSAGQPRRGPREPARLRATRARPDAGP